MPSVVTQNPAAHSSESKSAKKKKAKAALASEDRDESPASPAPAGSGSPEQATSIAGNESSESPYIRDLKKSIRNTSKKILNASKTQSIILENKDKTIEQLLAAKIINADQKRQVDNKPALEAELARTEDQLAQVLKLDEEWRATVASVKADTEKKLTEKHEQDKAEAVADAVAEAESKTKAAVSQTLEDGFLVLSQFLRLAADRRLESENSTADADLAVEGVLLKVYSGDDNAVAAISKLYHGSDDTTTAIDGTELATTYGQVRQMAAASCAHQIQEFVAPASEAPSEAAVENGSGPTEATTLVQTDPTVAYAGLTEIDAGTDVPMINGSTNGTAAEVEAPIPNADVDDSAANAAGENHGETVNDLAEEWVKVQKPAEAPQTQAAPAAAATPAPAAGSNPSWADDQPEPSAGRTSTEANDGFQSVSRNRGRGNGEGFRGGRGGHFRGGRGGSNPWRGDGQRGRGRGGPRGPRRDGGGKAIE